MAGALLPIAAAASAIGTIMGGIQSWREGQYQNELSKREQQVREQNANAAAARGQRLAIEERRQGELLSSQARAALGAGAVGAGGRSLDPSAIRTVAEIGQESEIRAMDRLFEGEDVARAERMEGKLARFRGKQALKSGQRALAFSPFKAAGQAGLIMSSGKGIGRDTKSLSFATSSRQAFR